MSVRLVDARTPIGIRYTMGSEKLFCPWYWALIHLSDIIHFRQQDVHTTIVKPCAWYATPLERILVLVVTNIRKILQHRIIIHTRAVEKWLQTAVGQQVVNYTEFNKMMHPSKVQCIAVIAGRVGKFLIQIPRSVILFKAQSLGLAEILEPLIVVYNGHTVVYNHR